MSTPPASERALPRVAVLLATRNGVRWLDEQLRSVLDQADVDVRVIASDDASTDGTREALELIASADSRVTVLPAIEASGSSAANFYRLIRDANIADDELVAFADQDDIWEQNKLAAHAALMNAGFDGVSSNVTTFGADGSSTLLRKDYPQRQFDYLLESPGPGSTFLLSNHVFALVRELLNEDPLASSVDYHDWLIYATARAAGMRWHIDPTPTVRYRQHDANTMGANVGARSAVSRLTLIRERWHREQATALARIAITLSTPADRAELGALIDLLEGGGPARRWKLARQSARLRRRPRDQRIIGLLILTGVW